MTRRLAGAFSLRVATCLLASVLAACAHQGGPSASIRDLPPLQLPEGELGPEQALATTSTPDMLAMTDEMKDFVERYATGSQRQRLQTLHRSLQSPAMVGIDYDPDADGTAAEVYHSGAANCLSYAHLFVAMARHAGLNANYLSTTLRPEWSRHGDQVALRRHVNVTVRLRQGEQYVVDIDPVGRDRVASADILDDREAFALYHGNLAMDALLKQDLEEAYAQAIRAISMGRDLDYLWTNLGIIYRRAGQDDAAEALYQMALSVSPNSRTAMNNLAILYAERGDEEQARYWEERVRKRREQNPFYHYYLGEKAEADGDLGAALAHYEEAIELKKTEAEFYYRVARLYREMQRREESRLYIQHAIEHARLVAEREEYRAFLDKLDADAVVTARFQPD